MNSKKKFAMGLFVLALLTWLPGQNGRGPGAGQGGRGPGGGQGGGQMRGNWDVLKTLPSEPLNEAERQGLLTLREEEKLARDVYLHLAGFWTQRIFSQIAASEQQHIDGVKILLDKYGLADPIADLDVGVFHSLSFQNLYNEMIAEGELSIERALTMGAAIEDLDIADLLTGIQASDNRDVLTLWQNLAKGSRNHLRAFTSRLELFGQTYSPKNISLELFESIISTEMERGFYDERGEPYFPAGGW